MCWTLSWLFSFNFVYIFYFLNFQILRFFLLIFFATIFKVLSLFNFHFFLVLFYVYVYVFCFGSIKLIRYSIVSSCVCVCLSKGSLCSLIWILCLRWMRSCHRVRDDWPCVSAFLCLWAPILVCTPLARGSVNWMIRKWALYIISRLDMSCKRNDSNLSTSFDYYIRQLSQQFVTLAIMVQFRLTFDAKKIQKDKTERIRRPEDHHCRSRDNAFGFTIGDAPTFEDRNLSFCDVLNF